MRQAQTLNEAQLRRVMQYCRSRRHPTRDETIILISFYAGLRAKEIAALTVGNVFDDPYQSSSLWRSSNSSRDNSYLLPVSISFLRRGVK